MTTSTKTLLKTLLFTLIAPACVTSLPVWFLLSSGRIRLSPLPVLLTGAVVLLIGVCVYLRCALDFAFVGKGTPAPIDPPTSFVSSGLYRRVRNPMYVGVLTIIFGEALCFQSWTLFFYACAIWLLFHSFVVFYEEPALTKRFGQTYTDYQQSVPRWLGIRRR